MQQRPGTKVGNGVLEKGQDTTSLNVWYGSEAWSKPKLGCCFQTQMYPSCTRVSISPYERSIVPKGRVNAISGAGPFPT